MAAAAHRADRHRFGSLCLLLSCCCILCCGQNPTILPGTEQRPSVSRTNSWVLFPSELAPPRKLTRSKSAPPHGFAYPPPSENDPITPRCVDRRFIDFARSSDTEDSSDLTAPLSERSIRLDGDKPPIPARPSHDVATNSATTQDVTSVDMKNVHAGTVHKLPDLEAKTADDKTFRSAMPNQKPLGTQHNEMTNEVKESNFVGAQKDYTKGWFAKTLLPMALAGALTLLPGSLFYLKRPKAPPVDGSLPPEPRPRNQALSAVKPILPIAMGVFAASKWRAQMQQGADQLDQNPAMSTPNAAWLIGIQVPVCLVLLICLFAWFAVEGYQYRRSDSVQRFWRHNPNLANRLDLIAKATNNRQTRSGLGMAAG